MPSLSKSWKSIKKEIRHVGSAVGKPAKKLANDAARLEDALVDTLTTPYLWIIIGLAVVMLLLAFLK